METLFTQNQIAERCAAVGRDIVRDLGPRFVLAPVLTGGFVFGADLLRSVQSAGGDPEVDFVQLASYGVDRESSGLVRVVRDFSLNLEGCTVLLVDDVLDSGRSLAHAKTMLDTHNAKRVAVAVAVTKENARKVPIKADYTLFRTSGDAFLIGYGMDDAGLKRGLPSIGVI